MTSNHWPASPARRPNTPTVVDSADLDTQIEALEQRLVAREAWLRTTTESLTQRAQHALTPKPWVLPVVGVGAVLWLGWRWWHRQNTARPVRVEVHESPTGHPVDKLADLPWAGLTALAWPLAPVAWRERLSPTAAVTVVSTALSIGRRLRQRRGH